MRNIPLTPTKQSGITRPDEEKKMWYSLQFFYKFIISFKNEKHPINSDKTVWHHPIEKSTRSHSGVIPKSFQSHPEIISKSSSSHQRVIPKSSKNHPKVVKTTVDQTFFKICMLLGIQRQKKLLASKVGNSGIRNL